MEEERPEDSKTTIGAWIMTALGAFLMLNALDVIPRAATRPGVPPAVLFGIGGMFAILGASLFVGLRSRWGQFLLGISMFLTGLAFLYVAFFADPKRMSGGIPFLPDAINFNLGRIAFGLFSILWFVVGIAAWMSAIRMPQDDDG